MATIKEHGILFSSAMVRAILAGQKTQTRRAVRGATGAFWDHAAWRPVLSPDGSGIVEWATDGGTAPGPQPKAPHGPVGRRLWVRETWHQCPHCERTVSYRAGGWREAPSGAPDDGGDRCDDDTRPLSPKCEAHGWRPSIHMPRWASRITLEVTRVRVERVGDISEEDAKAEGVTVLPLQDAADPSAWWSADPANPATHGRTPVAAYRKLWDEINGAGSFASNPWVWVYDFRRVG